jgi:hypothetical protein
MPAVSVSEKYYLIIDGGNTTLVKGYDSYSNRQALLIGSGVSEFTVKIFESGQEAVLARDAMKDLKGEQE